MRQLVITGPGAADWSDAEIPEPTAGEVRVRVEAVTTCPQWDLHIMGGEPMFPGMALPYPYYPGQPGHEMVGFVESVGGNVASFQPGERVVVWRDSGPARPGAYASMVSLPAENLLPVSDSLPPESIAPLELAMCVQVSFDQVSELGALRGQTVGVSGMGPAGLIAIQIARAEGASKVVAYDPVKSRRDLALALGADETLDPDAESRTDRFLDVGFDMTGLPAAIGFLIARTRKTVTMFGVVRDDIVFPPSHWYGGFALLGYGEHNLGAAKRALSWVERGQLDLSALVSESMGLSRYAEGVELLASKKAIKVLFTPD